jgi:two-component system C4-dicarboxylate transport response regulator DctD
MLIIDDEEHITAAVSDYFTISGYQVDCAQDESAARALLDRFDYAVVITDLRLSGCCHTEGMDIVGHVRNGQPGAACIVLTSYGDEANEVEARKRGADAFLQKPTPLHVLAEQVAQILNR